MVGVSLVVLVLIFILILTHKPHQINGSSMEPTFGDGSYIMGVRVSGDHVERGDIVVYESEPGVTYVQRVVGVSGDRLEIKDGILYINGERESSRHYSGSKTLISDSFIGKDCGADMKEVDVLPGGLFVMGDNRKSSYDSRDFGSIDAYKVTDRIEFCYWNCE